MRVAVAIYMLRFGVVVATTIAAPGRPPPQATLIGGAFAVASIVIGTGLWLRWRRARVAAFAIEWAILATALAALLLLLPTTFFEFVVALALPLGVVSAVNIWLLSRKSARDFYSGVT